MRAKSKLAVLGVCALLMLGFSMMTSSTAYAQATFTVSTNPNEVVHYGVTEVMGRVRLEMTGGTTQGSTVTVTYQGVTIKNTVATGITVVGSGALAGLVTVNQVVASSGTGGQVILSVAAGGAFGGLPNVDLITIDGVRADVSAKALNTQIVAQLSSAPSTANTFSNTSSGIVAIVNESMLVEVTSTSNPICLAPTNPSFKVTEGSAGVMVQYVASVAGTAAPADARALYGAVNNTRVNIAVANMPTGSTLEWPLTVLDSSVGLTGAMLELISQSASGDSALYEFTTPSQAASDAQIEVFDIVPTLAIDPDTAQPGTALSWAQLYPPNPAGATAVPRFNHPLINDPPDVLYTVSKCTTNLLFPFLTNAAGSNFDTGMAIANTSMDPYETLPQEGVVTWYFYGANAPAPVTTASVPAGGMTTAVLSAVAPGFQGYAIAICEFQYGHGFAFVTGKYNPGSVFDVAEGYLANVIPDPGFNAGVRLPAVPLSGQGSGENLGN